MAELKLTPHLVVADGDRAIAFYRAAFGAVERSRHQDGGGKIVHADLALGGHAFSLADEFPEWNALGPLQRGGTSVVMTIEVDQGVDELWAQGLAAGGTVVYPLADQFYGARSGRLADPFGHQWLITMPTEDVSNEEIDRRMLAWEQAQKAKD